VDPTSRAYAILGLARGCSPEDLRATYRKLVKRWHPDRYTADPAGQAEASARLREINGALRIVAADMATIRPSGSTVRTPASAETSPGPTVHSPGRPLTRNEIDAIVGAVGAESPIDTLLEWLGLVWPFGGALFLLLIQRRGVPPAPVETSLAFALLVLGIVLIVRRRLRSRRENRSG
jgi:DnaJ-like protein